MDKMATPIAWLPDVVETGYGFIGATGDLAAARLRATTMTVVVARRTKVATPVNATTLCREKRIIAAIFADYARNVLVPARETGGASEVKDSTGRTGIAINAKVTGSTPASDGTITYIFDPATGLPLEDVVASSTGAVVDRFPINSITTTNTLPTNPYL